MRERPFIHLHVHSPFSFLDGASRIEDLTARAAELGMPALAVTDHHNLCAAIEFQQLAMALGLKPIQGVEVEIKSGGGHLTLLAKGERGYSALCRLLTMANLGSPRRQPEIELEAIPEIAGQQLFALTGCRKGRVARSVLGGDYPAAAHYARRLREVFGADSLFVELEGCRLPGGRQLNTELAQLATELKVGLVVTNNVHYAHPKRFPVHDLLTCVRTLTKLDEVHPERRLNADNYLKSGLEMAESLWGLSEALVDRALSTSVEIAAACEPALRLGQRRHPDFNPGTGESAAAALRRLTYEGARRRYGRLTGDVRRRLDHELDIICKLGYEEYFLLVWDVVAYARRHGIRCAGRGSAADSAVAYCLQITDVDSIGRGLLFERFMSLERAEMPDIDIDFDARYRDEVTAYVYKRYGREHVATVATYNTFHARSAVRDLGKAMGFDPAEIDAMAKRLPWMEASRLGEAFERVPELRDSGLDPLKFRQLYTSCAAVAGFPRHLGTHLGGVVISREPLTRFTPLQMAAKGIVVTQLDKIGVEDLGLVKLDLLSLRTLGAVEDALLSINRKREPADHLRYESIAAEDQATYAMLGRGDTIGVFQLESPAQRALQPRLAPDRFEDLVASVALIRPGPIKGNMVEPFIARRKGQEETSYIHPDLQPILEKTYGVVLFQEQVIEIAMKIAGFSAGEADRLRRVMTHGRSREEMADIGRVFVGKAVARGIEPGVAETIFSYVAGYASYGFCEAHAAAFADIAYKTAYLLRHQPAPFYAAILSQQPMGYYPAHVLCVEARRRGIAILPPDVNRSIGCFTVETPGKTEERDRPGADAIRVGLWRIKNLPSSVVETIIATRSTHGPYTDLADFLRQVAPHGLDSAALDSLILAGACDGLASPVNRRALLWAGARLLSEARAGELPLYRSDAGLHDGRATQAKQLDPAGLAGMTDFTPWERLLREYEVLGFSTGPHPMSFYRRRLASLGYLDSTQLARRRLARGARVRVAGIMVRPHRPPTRSGKTMVFMSLEDERGLTDITLFSDAYDRYGKLIFRDAVPPLAVCGRLERRGRSLSVTAESVHELQEVLKAAPAPPLVQGD